MDALPMKTVATYHFNQESVMKDSIVEAVVKDLLDRSKVGISKYGVTLDRNDLSLRDWLQHAYEETLDQANYLKRSIIEMDRANSSAD